jgi:hypothetical protein
MFKSMKMQKPLLAMAAVGALGLAAYGIFHTISALADTGSPLPSDQAVINSADPEQANPDGAFCNPYGCAGCSGCVSLQYQQNVTGTPGTINTMEINYLGNPS